MKTSSSPSKSPLLFFLAILSVSFLSLYFLSGPPNGELNLNKIMRFSVEPSERTIQAHIEMIAMEILLETQDFTLPAREPVDLVCVVDFPKAKQDFFFTIIQEDLRKVLPLMNDQDRLSIFIYDEEEASNDSALTVVSLTNTTQQNKDKIFLANWTSFKTNFPKKTYGSLRNAIEILNLRETANPVTAIVLFNYYWNQKELEEAFRNLASKNGSHNFLFSFPGEYKFDDFVRRDDNPFKYPDLPVLHQAFEQSLLELQTSILGALDLSIKFEAENEVLSLTRSINVLPKRQEQFKLESVPVPRAPKTPMDLKIASWELVFTPLNMLNGSQVIKKSADMSVKVVKDGEKIDKDTWRFWNRGWILNDWFGPSPKKMILYKGHEGEVKVMQRNIEHF